MGNCDNCFIKMSGLGCIIDLVSSQMMMVYYRIYDAIPKIIEYIQTLSQFPEWGYQATSD